MDGYQSPELGDYSKEEYELRQEMRESTQLYDTANQVDNRADFDPVGTLKWLFGFKK
jgi:hypothetical protein